MLGKYLTFSRFTLFIALCISAIAAYYSVIGLTAIFAGAVIPIIVMGTILEISKITTTVWLHRYWNRASWSIKTYLTVAVITLACLTSMGIFGLLSKAHSDTGLVSGDVIAKIAIFDEKIKISKENIDANRKALRQLDEAVDQVMARSSSEQGADKAVQIRRQQSKERTRLLQEIEAEQKKISKLNEERAPIAAEGRKVEAEVGPIKYIAALIYGDNTDTTILERAVRWVIILIVVVFDPLAIMLILAANTSLKWEREDKLKKLQDDDIAAMSIKPPADVEARSFTAEEIAALDKSFMTPWPTEWDESAEEKSDAVIPRVSQEEINELLSVLKEEKSQPNFSQGNYQTTSFSVEPFEVKIINKDAKVVTDEPETPTETTEVTSEDAIETEGVTSKANIFSSQDDYAVFDGKNISIQALRHLKPELVVDGPIKNEILFGTKFPSVSCVGDIYTRVDVMPHKTFRFNGTRWIMIDRSRNTSYLQNIAYLQFLIAKIDSGEYAPEFLTDAEQEEISEYLKRDE